jgi:hypothetical protein
MPTVIRFDGLRVVIYTDDHRPPHVHVIGRGCEAIFRLTGPASLSVLQENFGFSRTEIARIRQRLDASMAILRAAWESIHG